MKTIYLTRNFQPVTISAVKPGTVYRHPEFGECRRLTARALCLASERLGKESDAFLGLVKAIAGAAEKEEYDGRQVDDWYGLVGLQRPRGEVGDLKLGICSRCGRRHWYGVEELQDLCFDCWVGKVYSPVF